MRVPLHPGDQILKPTEIFPNLRMVFREVMSICKPHVPMHGCIFLREDTSIFQISRRFYKPSKPPKRKSRGNGKLVKLSREAVSRLSRLKNMLSENDLQKASLFFFFHTSSLLIFFMMTMEITVIKCGGVALSYEFLYLAQSCEWFISCIAFPAVKY